MPSTIKIKDQTINLGEEKTLDFNVARLPTGTIIDLPVIVSRSKVDGPVLLLLGGMHGDEINGVEIMRRIIIKKLYKPKIGTVICIPIINVFGFINFSREITDGKDVNRSFPGSAKGSLASQVAHFLRTEILPNIDYGIDFHTGGKRINNYPQVRALLDNPINQALCKAFAAPFTLNAPLRDKSLRKTAASFGKSILVYEAGESLRLRKNAIETGIDGTLRVMKHLGIIDEAPTSSSPSIELGKSTWMRANMAGMHHSIVRCGTAVKKNDILGYITDPYGQMEKAVKSQHDGHIIAINNNPIVNRGDALVHIGLVQ